VVPDIPVLVEHEGLAVRTVRVHPPERGGEAKETVAVGRDAVDAARLPTVCDLEIDDIGRAPALLPDFMHNGVGLLPVNDLHRARECRRREREGQGGRDGEPSDECRALHCRLRLESGET
jgi:hypothetical protein